MRTALFRRRPSDQPEAHAGDEPDQPAEPDLRLQSRWTGGSRLATRTATALLWTALLAGPAGLALTVLQGGGSGQRTAPPAPPVAIDRAGEQAAVSEFAQRYVVTWLQSPRGQEKQLAPYVNVAGLTLPEVAWVATQPAAADIRRLDGGAWTVLVGVTVTAPQPPGATAAAPRRYFEVPVRYQAGALVALALPTPVAAPAAAAAPPLAYRYRAIGDELLARSVQEFLSALLTGVGDVTRYVSPGTQITPVLPPPYRTVEVSDVMVDRDPMTGAGSPTPGAQLRVLVSASAAAEANQQIGVQYALTLAARAGRWEVRALDPTPAVASAPPAAAGAPGPSAGEPALPPGSIPTGQPSR